MSAEAAPAAQDAPVMFYNFKSSDGVVCKISEKAVGQSATLQLLVSTMNITPDDANEAIPLDNVNGKTLELVFKWCEENKYKQAPTDEECQPLYVTIPEFDAKLMEIDDELLFDLICAANYLDIKRLFVVSCRKVSDMAKKKTAVELRQIFGIPTNEEDAAAAAAEKAAADTTEGAMTAAN